MLNLLKLCLISALFIVGCNAQSPIETEVDNCRMIEHTKGKTCVPLNPQRVIVLGVPTMANAITLGVKPIGTILYFEKIPPYLPGKIEDIEIVGTGEQPNIEKIVTLKPDLIIAMNDWNNTYQQLSQIAPTVVDNWNGYPSWKIHFNFTAKVLGREAKAKEIWANYQARIEEIQKDLGSDYENVTISLMFVCCGVINVDLKDSFSGSILKDIGFKRPLIQDKEGLGGLTILSEESIFDMDGDILFLFKTEEDKESSKLLEKLKKNPLWQKLKAVKNDKVYEVNLPTWRGGNPLAAEAVIDDLEKYLVDKK